LSVKKNKIEPDTTVITDNPAKPTDTIIRQGKNVIPAETPVVNSSMENYNKSFGNALAAFNAQDFEKALKLIKEAETYIVTEDAKKYKKLCEDELEKIEIQKRKNLYEYLMDFGNFVVVKKKTTGLQGAINDKGIEVIRCVYISSSPSGNNRLFQRSDNLDLYDVYAPDGVLLTEGSNGFE
jgi:hypothetical protein